MQEKPVEGSKSKTFILLALVLALAAPLACNLPGSGPLEAQEPQAPAPPTATLQPSRTPSPAPLSPTAAQPTRTSRPPEPTAVLEPGERILCAENHQAVALLVQPSLAEALQGALETFRADLCRAGYAVFDITTEFADPGEVRAYLAARHASSQGALVGALLLGDIPHAYQWVTLTYSNPDIPPTQQEVISFQYYADLDGIFETSPGYTSPGAHAFSFDVHRGPVDWEIWIGVLPLYKDDLDLTAQALRRYFARNHAYRSGEYSIPRGFVQINEHIHAATPADHEHYLEFLRTGKYAWTPFSSDPHAQFFFDSPSAGLSVAQGYQALREGVADFFVIDTHGSPLTSGQVDVDWLQEGPIGTVFYWNNGCAVGNLDVPGNFLTAVLYSPQSRVLVAKGSTNDSGGLGTNQQGFFGHNIATALHQGKTFGEAVLAHVNVPLIHPWSESREFHFASLVILGDPTLRLKRAE